MPKSVRIIATKKMKKMKKKTQKQPGKTTKKIKIGKTRKNQECPEKVFFVLHRVKKTRDKLVQTSKKRRRKKSCVICHMSPVPIPNSHSPCLLPKYAQ